MQSKIALLLISLLAGLSLPRAEADPLSLGDGGLRIDGGSMGAFTLTYPALDGQKIVGKSVSGNTATVKYDSGAVLTMRINGSEVTYSYQGVPGKVKEARSDLSIPFSYTQGGQWKMAGGTATPFPVEKPPKPHLYQNHGSSFTLTNFEGKSFTLEVPEYSYLELTDLREWNNNQQFVFNWHKPFQAEYHMTVTVGGGDPSGKPVTLVDEFGQIKTSDWPGKVKSADELAADVKSEQEYYAGLTPPAFDPYGGLPGSAAKLGLQKTGFFHVEKKGEKWMLVDPDGNLFFHSGPCSFQPGDDYTLVKGRRNIFDWLPPHDGEYKTAYKSDMGDSVISFHTVNMIRKYGKPYTFEDFEGTMIDRVRKWGFNSVGAFSGVAPAVIAARHFPYVSSLPLGGIGEIPGIGNTWDPFDPANVTKVQANFAKSLPPHADDPLLIGYFLTNEPIYEDIPKVVPNLKGSKWACKRVLVQMLAAKYGTPDAFNKAWGLSAASFDELNDQPLAVKTKDAAADMHEFTGRFFETYYKLLSDNFHEHDKRHMLIGNRFQSGTINNEQLCRVAGKYLDIMSFNYYAYAPDKDFLKRIYQWTGGRPMFLSEFNWSSSKESGLAGGQNLATQQARGLAYRHYVEQAASLGFVVGIEWFTLLDQASTGRWFQGFNGERGNSGLIAVTDRPYKPMVAEMLKTNYGIYDVLLGTKPPFVYDDPHFAQTASTKLNASVPHTKGPITLDGATQNWPSTPAETLSGKRVVHGSDSGGTEAAFKITWDEKKLYVLVNVVDPTPLQNKQKTASNLWDGDAVEIFLGGEKTDQGGALLFTDRHLVVGATGAGKVPYYYGNSPQQYPCDTLIVPGGDGKGYTLEAAIPWEALGVVPKVGAKLLFDIGIDDSTNGEGRQHQIMWNGTERNSGDRTHWGTITLLE